MSTAHFSIFCLLSLLQSRQYNTMMFSANLLVQLPERCQNFCACSVTHVSGASRVCQFPLQVSLFSFKGFAKNLGNNENVIERCSCFIKMLQFA